MHVVCSSVEECYKVWPEVCSRIRECPGIISVQLTEKAYCCQLRQGMSDAEEQLARLLGADIEVAACTCYTSASKKRHI